MHGGDVVCVAQNDALLEGLLTLIHKERESEFGMSSIQVSLLNQNKAALMLWKLAMLCWRACAPSSTRSGDPILAYSASRYSCQQPRLAWSCHL